MADYQRILSYLYRYEKAEKKECHGFVKAEQRAGSLRMTIQIDDERLLQGMELKLCFYERQGENWQVWQLDTVAVQGQKEEVYLTYPSNKLPEGFHIKGQSGVLLYYQNGFYYGSVWIGEKIPVEVLEPLRWHKMKGTEDIEESQTKEPAILSDEEKSGTLEANAESESAAAPENMDIQESPVKSDGEDAERAESTKELENVEKAEHVENSEDSTDIGTEENTDSLREEELEKNVEIKEVLEAVPNAEPEIKAETKPVVDTFEKMWINFSKKKPPVDNIFNTAFYEGCRIEPADLEKLGEEAGILRSNQFLLKGYERYKHLLAGKVRYAGEERYCIGVPGIYENREKYMADIYQFPIFLSLTENHMKTGSFGYWLYLLRV